MSRLSFYATRPGRQTMINIVSGDSDSFQSDLSETKSLLAGSPSLRNATPHKPVMHIRIF